MPVPTETKTKSATPRAATERGLELVAEMSPLEPSDVLDQLQRPVLGDHAGHARDDAVDQRRVE